MFIAPGLLVVMGSCLSKRGVPSLCLGGGFAWRGFVVRGDLSLPSFVCGCVVTSAEALFSSVFGFRVAIRCAA